MNTATPGLPAPPAFAAPERAFAVVVGLVLAVLAVHWQTTAAMAALWEQSTYSHCYTVLPVFAWLVWERRHALAGLPVRPSWGAAAVLVAIVCAWLVARVAAASGPTQFAVVAMAPAAAAALLGLAWLRTLAFAWFFLFFAVPVGEGVTPLLMDWTADFTVAALRWSGVPVFREGNHFAIPGGNWSVVEACSGIRYMTACLMTSTLFAWLFYRSNVRRVVFVAAALALAVVANWLRAYGIVMLAHFSDNRLATGVDHLVYGFVFFGVIMALVFGLGMMWRERPGASPVPPGRPAHAPPAGAVPAAPAPLARRSAPAAAASLAVVTAALAGGPLAVAQVDDVVSGRSVATASIAPRAGWIATPDAPADWQPQARNPSWTRVQAFEKDGRRVAVYLAAFDRTTPDSKLVTSSNRLVPAESSAWRQVDRGTVDVPRGAAGAVTLQRATLKGAAGRIVAWHGYWVGGTLTSNPVHAVARQVLGRLTSPGEPSAWVVIYTAEDEETASGAQLLGQFSRDMMEAVDERLRQASGLD